MSECLEDDSPEPLSLEITSPNTTSDKDKAWAWALTAHNKKVLKGWLWVCEQFQENAQRCYERLRSNPMRGINKRCYAMKHKNYAGAWCYEVSSAARIYYKPRPETKDILVYYAGPHPTKAPYPPRTL